MSSAQRINQVMHWATSRGTKAEYPVRENTGIRITNFALLLTIFLLIVNVVQNYFKGHYESSLIVTPVIVVYWIIYLLNVKYHRLSRTLLIILATSAYTFFSIYSGKELNVVPTYLLSILFTYGYFQSLGYRVVLISFIGICYAISHYCTNTLDMGVATEIPAYLNHTYFFGSLISGAVLITLLIREKETLAQNAQKLLTQVSQKNRELESFSYISSHNLKTPLRTISSFSSLLERSLKEGDFDKSKTYLEYISQASSRMYHMTEDVLSYAKLETMEPALENVNVSDIFKELKRTLQENLHRGLNFSYPMRLEMQTNPLLIRILFENLLENGIKYNDEMSVNLEVRHRIEEDLHVFRIKDNGIGIPSQHRKQIFQMFQRLHNDDHYEGTGIGLAICEKIVSLLKGSITFYSTVGEGTTFVIKLPILSTNDSITKTSVIFPSSQSSVHP